MDIVEKNFMKGQSRGPENSKFQKINSNLILGFHRLAINGLDEISNQPIVDDGIYLICNGEIYNYKSIYKHLSYEPQTNSDCEAIICLYKAYGIEYTIQNLDGVFSFLLYDSKKNTGYVARDPFGIRPLYYGLDGKNIYFSSLLKQISDLCNECLIFHLVIILLFPIMKIVYMCHLFIKIYYILLIIIPFLIVYYMI